VANILWLSQPFPIAYPFNHLKGRPIIGSRQWARRSFLMT